MAERSELEELRRLDELESKAGGGAAFVTPKQRSTPVSPETKERVRSFSETAGEYLFGEPERTEFSGSEVLGATGVGTAAGLAAPKILEKGGRIVSKIPLPYAKPIGSAAEALGIAMGKIPALQRAYKGGIGGGAASTAEQATELAGAPKAVSLPVGFATGGVVPELETAIKKIIAKVGKVAFGTESMTNAIMRDLQSQGVEVTPKVAQLIEKEVNAFRQAPKGSQPQESLYGALKTGTTNITAEAEKLAQARKQAGLVQKTEAEQRAEKMSTAKAKTETIGDQAIKEAQATRANIGTEQEASDIGTSLRERINKLFGNITTKRSEAYNAQKQLRDSVVAEKENAGQLVKDMPEYKNLLDDLKRQLLIGAEAQKQTTAPVTEKGVLQAYRNIYDAVTARKVQVGLNEEGNPVFKTFPTSFDALDDVRRRLGDVAFGKDVEGYTAIGSNIAKKYYGKISELQSKFAGEAHDELQGGYEIASRLLDKYKSKIGKKATAEDRFDPTRFNTDPASLPRNYFNSKQSVNDLIELTGGDRGFVVQNANNFATRELKNKTTATTARNWLDSNSDWLNALPEVRSKVEGYVKALERAERIAGKSKTAASILGTRGPREISKGEQSVSLAEKEAGQITKQAQDRVDKILGSKFPNEEIEKLMLSGDFNRWQEVAPILGSSPAGKENLEKAVRQVMSRVSPKSMGDVFRDNVRQRLEMTKILKPEQLDRMQSELDSISNLTLSPEQKMSLLQRITRNVLTTIPSTMVGAPVAAVVGED